MSGKSSALKERVQTVLEKDRIGIQSQQPLPQREEAAGAYCVHCGTMIVVRYATLPKSQIPVKDIVCEPVHHNGAAEEHKYIREVACANCHSLFSTKILRRRSEKGK